MIPSFLQKLNTRRGMIAKLRRVRGKRPSGPTVSGKSSKRRRSCSLSAGGDASNRLSGGHARADGHRTYPLATARGQQTFSSSKELHANGEIVMLQYFQPAHT